MRLLFWYCERFGWNPSLKTLEDVPEAEPMTLEQTVVAFIHVEPPDVVERNPVETKLVKNAKWLARKWGTPRIVLHSFTHLGEQKADPEDAKGLIDRVQKRLETAGYTVVQTPYGYFNDLSMDTPGHPLARIYKEF
jgi:Archaea-specific editing domain of threonyl-tRNA synthetase